MINFLNAFSLHRYRHTLETRNYQVRYDDGEVRKVFLKRISRDLINCLTLLVVGLCGVSLYVS